MKKKSWCEISVLLSFTLPCFPPPYFFSTFLAHFSQLKLKRHGHKVHDMFSGISQKQLEFSNFTAFADALIVKLLSAALQFKVISNQSGVKTSTLIWFYSIMKPPKCVKSVNTEGWQKGDSLKCIEGSADLRPGLLPLMLVPLSVFMQ